jgi:predicted Rdx family selenoprotein
VAPAPPPLVRSRRLPGSQRRGRTTEEEIQSSGPAILIDGIRGPRAALSLRRHQESRTATLRRSALRPKMGKPPPRQRVSWHLMALGKKSFALISWLPLLGSYLLIEMALPTLMRIRRDWILRWTWLAEQILKRKMVRGLGEASKSIWRTRRCRGFLQMSLLQRSSRCSWIWRSPAWVTKNRRRSGGSHHSSSSTSPLSLRSSMRNQLYLLFHRLCQWLLEAGWVGSHLLVTLVQFQDYQLPDFIILWTSSRVHLLDYSMLHCFLRRRYDQSAALHIVTLHSRSSTTNALQR